MVAASVALLEHISDLKFIFDFLDRVRRLQLVDKSQRSSI